MSLPWVLALLGCVAVMVYAIRIFADLDAIDREDHRVGAPSQRRPDGGPPAEEE